MQIKQYKVTRMLQKSILSIGLICKHRVIFLIHPQFITEIAPYYCQQHEDTRWGKQKVLVTCYPNRYWFFRTFHLQNGCYCWVRTGFSGSHCSLPICPSLAAIPTLEMVRRMQLYCGEIREEKEAIFATFFGSCAEFSLDAAWGQSWSNISPSKLCVLLMVQKCLSLISISCNRTLISAISYTWIDHWSPVSLLHKTHVVALCFCHGYPLQSHNHRITALGSEGP